MSLAKKPMRYAHPEGHTDVCYFSDEKRGLITCGSDGDVRYWLNLMDDDPSASCVAEQAIAIVSKNGKIYVGHDNNTVQILTYPDLEKEGIVTRFSAPVSALATTANSNLIVSGGCDMRIQVTNINTLDSIELKGHEAPILGLSLDPKEEYVASSSADGSIRVWNINMKRVVQFWNNVVPKCNDFFTAKAYCTPSFHSKEGKILAYPCGKDIIVVERSTWKESFRLKCPNLKSELSICKFSECGLRLAASSVQGEIVVWNIESMEIIGYIDHDQNAKITSLSWHPDNSNEVAYCDSRGQLGCIEVKYDKPTSNLQVDTEVDTGQDNDMFIDNIDDDDGENVISLDKIKASVNLDEDRKSYSDVVSQKGDDDTKKEMPEIYVQAPFQPGSSPVHLLSRFMVWNDVGIVKCYNSDDQVESSIEVEFHDTAIHRAIHINNYLGHNIAALSRYALAFNCPSSIDCPSKLVAIALQGWGTGNKEWSIDLPEGEEGQCIAAGDNFIAVATSRRNLRLFTIGGTQREIVALPGPVVTMNALGNYLVIAYHNGLGTPGDQHMNLFWMQIRKTELRNQILNLPLSPTSDLMWLGISDAGSPVVMDADDIIRVYDKRSSLWKVVCDVNQKNKGKADHYFIIGVSETERLVRCVLCKGSYYPPTTPRPVVTEILLTIPLCDPDCDKTEKEKRLWQLGSNPLNENEAVLSLIALACRSNVEYRAVELCEAIASDQIIDLAIKYAARMNRMALVKKLESIIENKETTDIQNGDTEDDFMSNNDFEVNQEELALTLNVPSIPSTPEVEIKPLSMNETLSGKKSNPFLRSKTSTAGLIKMDLETKTLPKLSTTKITPKSRPKLKSGPQKQSFVGWFAKNKKDLQEEFPELSDADLSKKALQIYKERNALQKTESQKSDELMETKKRKLSSPETEENNQPKRSSAILSNFAFDK